MALKFVLYNTDTRQHITGEAPGAPVDQSFDVGEGGVDEFTVTYPFTGSNKIDVLVDGTKKREGGSYDFTRDTVNNKILMTYTVAENSWVEVRVYP